MIRCITSTRIARPVAEVFAFLQPVENYPLWQEITNISATNGMRKGSRITYQRSGGTHGGAQTDGAPATIEMTENNGFNHMASMSVGGKYKARTTFKLSPDSEGGTRFVLEQEAESLSLPKEAETALQYQAETRNQEDLDRLKRILEETTAGV